MHRYLTTLTCLFLITILLAPQEAFAGKKRPNILFIMVDDMGYADPGCYGGKAIPTPNMDKIAKQGLRFTQAYAGSTVCAPSRCSLMTGFHQGHASVRGNTGGIALRDEDVTVAELLQQAGYATGGFGKWGLGDLRTTGVPEKQGFDVWYGYYHQIHAHYYCPDYLIRTGKKEMLPGNKGFYKKHKRTGPFPLVEPGTGEKRQYAAYLIFEETKKFIREHAQSQKSFFCYAAWTPPHGEYIIPETDPAWKQFANKKWSLKARIVASYVAMIDRQVGELMDLLEELNIDDNTIVFFCSDHGADSDFDGILDSCGPLRGKKRSMHEGGLRVPMIVRWPGTIKAGTVSDLQWYFPDVLPTFAELAGISEQVPPNIDGLSIVPTLLGQEDRQKRHPYLYWEWPTYNWGKRQYTGMMQGLRQGDWKLVRHSTKEPWQLYDLSKDISETNNLAKKHLEIVKQLDALVREAHVDQRPQIEPSAPKGKKYR